MAEGLSDHQSRLSAAQKAALEKRIRDAARASSSPARIALRADREAPVPLSSTQQRLWFLDQLVPGSSWYNVTRTVRIEGPLEPETLARAFDAVVTRHESLRTSIETREGIPVQIVLPPSPLALPVISVEDVPDSYREAAALALALEDAERPFNLRHPPLFRALLLRISPTNHILQVTAHHIVTDGWSMEVLFREVSSVYEAATLGVEPSLSPLPLQYLDFCLWQRKWLDSDTARNQIAHWAEKLRGAQSLDLPTDRLRSAMPSFRGAHRTAVVPPQVLKRLATLAKDEGATLFMVLLAGFEVFLQRHTGQEDISVATPIASRALPELEGLIGFFANTIVFRSDLSGEPSFREVVRRVRDTALDAYSHQDVPLEKLVDVLRPERRLAQNPLAQVAFALHNTPRTELRLPGARVTPLELLTRTARFDLELHARETNGSLSCTLVGASDLFEEETLGRFLDRYETLLHSVAEKPDDKVGELDLLPEAERRTLLSWSGAKRDYRAVQQIQEFLELQAEQTPAAVALDFESSRLTYDELNRRANRLAWHLRALGVGPDVLVGVCLERSLEMVIALIAVLKAGGAYVPLDPAYPAERLAFMSEDAQIPVLVTDERLEKTFPRGPEVRVCRLDADADAIAKELETNPEILGTPENAAYVIYTSGSTGKPKGVVVTHANVDRLFTATEGWFGFDEREVWTLFHSYAFDFSVWELWGALRYGGRLVVVPQWMTHSPEAFHELLARSGVTVLNQTPSAFRQLIAADAMSSAELSLRLVIFGGEALEPGMLGPWFDRHGYERPRLVNMYGITETTVHVTYHPVTRRDLEKPSSSVIGVPIPDLQVYVLDRGLRLSPVGVPGEMHIAGGGVARGYLRRPELTRQRFIANEFGEGRLYRSGDLVRYRSDGELEYLSRIDQQVKIRGHRIELGEIEAALAQHPAVREAVVVAREDLGGDRRLVAYLTERQPLPSSSELRSHLKRTLPEYMIPAAFVAIDKLPMTPSGKVDRKALPAPDAVRPELDGAFVEPQSPTERRLAEIWAEVLRIERVGRNDNFFDLGGDSILSIQIVARANRAGLRLTPNQLFRYQTVAELAAVAEPASTPREDHGPVAGPVPLTPIQRWFLEGQSPDPNHYNQAVLLETLEPLDPILLDRAFRELVIHHDALRLRVAKEGDGWRQIDAAAEESPFFERENIGDLPTSRHDGEIAAAALRAQTSLDLGRGPLLRAVLFDCGRNARARLLVVVHHIAVDGVSWRILLEDLETVYARLRRGEEPALPPRTTSFQEWAERLAEHARSDAVRSERDFWFSQARSSNNSSLPIDRLDGVNMESSRRTVSISLAASETRALLQEVPAAYRTQINDVLLTALAQAFGRWTDSPDLLVNLEGHGREEIFSDVDLSRTVGWFTTIFPVRLGLDSADPGAALKETKERLRAIPNRGIGYGLLRYLGGEGEVADELARFGQAEVSFNYLGRFDPALSGSSLFRVTAESPGPLHSPRALRRHLLEIEGVISEGRLQMDWNFSENVHARETIERLAESFLATLRALIAHCQSVRQGEYTPADFPLARFDQDRLQRVLRKLGKQ